MGLPLGAWDRTTCPTPGLRLAEYDRERPNAGVRLGPVHGVALLAALQNGDGLSGGVSYTFALH